MNPRDGMRTGKAASGTMPKEPASAGIELNRRFAPAADNEYTGTSWVRQLQYGRNWRWPDLLNHRRVVLVADGKSGKSTEFRRQVNQLVADERFAFYIPLRAIPRFKLPDSIGFPDLDVERRWRESTSIGFFFLDSVDELLLTQENFDDAINYFRQWLKTDYARARIFISSRGGMDWPSKEDLDRLDELLPAVAVPVKEAEAQEKTPEAVLTEAVFGATRQEHRTEKLRSNASKEDEVLVVTLAGLDGEQIFALARFYGVSDPKAFRSELYWKNILSRATRPGDIKALASIWNQDGNFGSLHSLTLRAIEQDLEEPTGKSRTAIERLSRDEAMIGAERLAFAALMTRSLTLVATDDQANSQKKAENHRATCLSLASVLPDWPEPKRAALMRLPLFAVAGFDGKQFQERDNIPFLAAQYLRRLASSHSGRREALAFVFGEQYAVATIRPGMEGVAAWLSLGGDDLASSVVTEVMVRNPLILLQQGDPSQLPLQIRIKLTALIVESNQELIRQHARIEDPFLSMLAAPDLAPTIRKLWPTARSNGAWTQLLRMIRLGSIADCVDLARPIAESPTEELYGRQIAIAAMTECKDSVPLQREAERLRRVHATENNEYLLAATQFLFPEYLSLDDLKVMLPRLWKANTKQFSSHFELQQIHDACVTQDQRDKLGEWIADLCLSKPHAALHSRVSSEYGHLAAGLSYLTLPAVKSHLEVPVPEHLIRMLQAVERGASYTAGPVSELQTLIEARPKLKRQLLWADVAEFRDNVIMKVSQVPMPHNLMIDRPLYERRATDVEWLLEDADKRADGIDRQIAFGEVLRLVDLTTAADGVRASVERIAAADPELQKMLVASQLPPSPPLVWDDPALDERVAESRRLRQQEREAWLRFRTSLSDPSILYDGERLKQWSGQEPLRLLMAWLQYKTGNPTYSCLWSWPELDRAFHQGVGEAFGKGLKALWRIADAQRPVHSPGKVTKSWTSILATAGIVVESMNNPQWARGLNKGDAERAMAHLSMSEEAVTPQVEQLLEAHPSTTTFVMSAIEHEWALRSQMSEHLLHNLVHKRLKPPAGLGDALASLVLRIDAQSPDRLVEVVGLAHRVGMTARSRRDLAAHLAKRFAAQGITLAWEGAYLASLLFVDVRAGMKALRAHIASAPSKTRDKFACELIAEAVRTATRSPDSLFGEMSLTDLASFVRVMCRYIPDAPETSTATDSPQFQKRVVLKHLFERCGAEAYIQTQKLLRIKGCWPPDDHDRLLRDMAIRDSATPVWDAREASTFDKTHASPALTGELLLGICTRVLADCSDDLARDDSSEGRRISAYAKEDPVQLWLHSQLKARSKDRYTVYREPVVNNGKRPDLVLTSVCANVAVAIEIKHGNKKYTLERLESALRNQLCELYLRPEDRRHGVFLVFINKPRHWPAKRGKKRLDFPGLIAHLKGVAARLLSNSTGPVKVDVVGLDVSGFAPKSTKKGKATWNVAAKPAGAKAAPGAKAGAAKKTATRRR